MPDGFIPQGLEFKVSSHFISDQQDPTITALADGGYVVIWQSSGQDGDGFGIYGQRYDSDGVIVGGEFSVNSQTTLSQSAPSITALAAGGFVVTWQSDGQDGDGAGIYGQRFNSVGVVVGGEFQVNTVTALDQSAPTTTGLTNGGFVVTWQSDGQDGAVAGIYGQRYDSSGVAAGTEFLVNTVTALDQSTSSITTLADGDFVVTWQSDGQDGDGFGIYGQRYDATGLVVGVEFQVSTETIGDQWNPAITSLAGGGFVVTWQSDGQDGNGEGIFAQRFDADGVAEGAEFQVNTQTALGQLRPTITGLADGGFVVTWQSDDQDGDGFGIYGQRYDATGFTAGNEFLISSETAGNQITPVVTALNNGGFVITWASIDGQDGDLSGVYGQQFASQTFGDSTDQEMLGTADNDWIGGQGGRDILNGLAGDDIIFGGEEDDILYGAKGNDELHGGDDDDVMYGAKGNDILYGDDNDDTLNGGDGNDILEGGDGYDVLNGDDGNDTLNGGARKDVLKGGKGDDLLSGGSHADLLKGGKGNDILNGDNGDDILKGGKGNDIIEGGAGDDELYGGKGADIFVFSAGDGNDVIYSFTDGVDKLDLSAFGFGSEAIAKTHFFEKGSASNDVVGFEFEGTKIRIEGIDFGDISGVDLILI